MLSILRAHKENGSSAFRAARFHEANSRERARNAT